MSIGTKNIRDVASADPLTNEQMDRCIAEAIAIRETVPGHWRVSNTYGPAGYRWEHRICASMSVVLTVDYALDGKCWIHASIAREDRMPDYSDLVKLKQEFIGDGRKAVMVLSARCEHVNIHNYCLHLFCCLDEDPLPDFTRGTGSL